MTSVADSAEGLRLRQVYASFPTGVAVLAADVDGVVGIAASSFVPVSLSPPLVSVCVAHTSTTWPRLSRAARIGISVLAEGQEEIGRRIGARDRSFEQLPLRRDAGGSVFLDGAAAWFETSIWQQVRAGDHDIVVFAIHDLAADPQVAPLVFHASSYRKLA